MSEFESNQYMYQLETEIPVFTKLVSYWEYYKQLLVSDCEYAVHWKHGWNLNTSVHLNTQVHETAACVCSGEPSGSGSTAHLSRSLPAALELHSGRNLRLSSPVITLQLAEKTVAISLAISQFFCSVERFGFFFSPLHCHTITTLLRTLACHLFVSFEMEKHT